MNRPCLFISAVSDELRTARQSVAATVRTLGFDAVSQDDFPTDHGELRQWLRERIDRCEGLVQIVGQGYGAEPPDVDSDHGRVSYTQFEFLHARAQRKKTWVIMVGDACQRDAPIDRLDLPRDAAHPDPAAYQAERPALQQAYRARLRAENVVRHRANNETELKNVVLSLRDDLGELRRKGERTLRRIVASAVVFAVLMLGGGWIAFQRLDANTQKAATVSSDRIRDQLIETITQTHQRELAEADKASDWKERQRLREIADTQNAARRGRVAEVTAAFFDIQRSGAATSVFKELTRIFTDQGVDEAIAYVSSQRGGILQAVKARASAARERNRADLKSLLQAAALHETKGQTVEARSLYTEILSIEPEWPEALHAGFWFLIARGDTAREQSTLGDAAREFDGAQEFANRLSRIDSNNSLWRRDLAVSHERLGNLALARGKLDDAARMYGESLAITMKSVTMQSSNSDRERDLSVAHERLGNVWVLQGKLEDAARSYAESLAIAKKLATQNPRDSEGQRDLSISHHKLGNVWFAQGKIEDAARAYAEGLVIAKQLALDKPGDNETQRDLSISHDVNGKVWVELGKLDTAAHSFAESLEIRKSLLRIDPSNTEWQRDLSVSYSRLGDLSVSQGQLQDAVRSYGDSLAIRMQLAIRDSSNTQWQRDLSVTHFKISKVEALQRNWTHAMTNAQAAFRIDDRLSSLDPSNATWQKDQIQSDARLADLRKQISAAK